MTDLLPELTTERARFAYGTYLRPKLAEQIRSIGLDVRYHRGEGDLLWHYDDKSGAEIEILDLLGGFGASLFGHRNQDISERVALVREAGLPFHAQASVRGYAGLLAERLSQMIGRTTGCEYVVTFGSTGTEAVEAALKHADMEYTRRVDEVLGRHLSTRRALRRGVRQGTIRVGDGLIAAVGERLGGAHYDTLDEMLDTLGAELAHLLGAPPGILAIEGAFHGKTTGSLMLTHGPGNRVAWRRVGTGTTFLPWGDVPGIARAVEAARIEYPDIEIGSDRVARLVERSIVGLRACFVEPVQGEGGIRVLPKEYLEALRQAADVAGFPLVFDEIQSGMGRTGTFLAAEPSGVHGDYYLLSKALGGGAAKLSAMAVDRRRYIEEFGVVHTSTFAEDDYSSLVGLAALDLVEAQGGALMERCTSMGEILLNRLSQIAEKYPEQIAEVRGKGLMVGVEIRPQFASRSPMLRVISEQGLLAFVVCGFLLREHQVRVAPALSAHSTLRLEPSSNISEEQIERFAVALEDAARRLRDSDVRGLVGFMAGLSGTGFRGLDEQGDLRDLGEQSSQLDSGIEIAKVGAPELPSDCDVAFLVHFAEPGDLRYWEPGLAVLSDLECEDLLDRACGVLDPFLLDLLHVRSTTGAQVTVHVIAMPFLPAHVITRMRAGDRSWALDLVRQGVDVARMVGCAVVGFGGYTSIVTNGCLDIVEDEMALTTGNSLTVAAAVAAVRKTIESEDLGSLRLGIVGATGNIGAVLTEVLIDALGDAVEAVTLFGRSGAESRLVKIANGLSSGEVGVKVSVSTDLEGLRDMNVIVSATNSPSPVIGPEHLGDGVVVLCDVAVPGDVALSKVAAARPNAIVLRGGTVHAPFGQSMGVTSVTLDEGEVYGCMAETLLLGLAGEREHFSYGPIRADQVRQIAAIAAEHGFTFEPRRYGR